jgi:toxin FitB
VLIDSNVIIYAAKPEHQELRRFIARHAPAVSVISYVEVLGYHRLTESCRLTERGLWLRS